MLRGIVDDWQQMGALYGHSQMMRAGQWDTAQLLLSAADEPLLGPIDTPRGQFGYELAAVPQILAGGVYGGVRSALRPRLFKNLYPLDPIDVAKGIPTSQLSRISGNFNYVITRDGRLIVGRSAHTSLTVGADVRAAGEVQLFNGRIKWIDNASGHYQPTGAGMRSLVEEAFNSIGLDATGKFILRTF